MAIVYAENRVLFQYDSIFDFPSRNDKVTSYLKDTKSKLYTHNILDSDLKKNIYTNNILHTLDYVQYGRVMASTLQEELAFQCYYMAHLKDHKNIRTNADLQFETYDAK